MAGNQAISSNNVVINDQVIPAIIIYSTCSGKIVDIILSTDQMDKTMKLKLYGVSNIRDLGDLVILPGIVDSHVHLNEPGRTDWEGFETGTKAAASGGVTTVIDMPLNAIPPTTSVENFNIKTDAAQGQCWVDVGFWGGVIPGNQEDLIPLINSGIRGFKCFMIHSGVDEFPAVSTDDLKLAFDKLNGQQTIMMFHAEQDDHESHGSLHNHDEYSSFLDSRPDSFEVNAIRSILDLAPRAPDLNFHIVHLASSQAIHLLQKAQASGIKLSTETCFHYLSFHSEIIPDKATWFKCAPPIRNEDNKRKLWDALLKNDIQTVVSDHSPCTPQLKKLDSGDFITAWGGIASVGLGLPVLWTTIERDYPQITFADIARWMCLNTSAQAGVEDRKGSIEIGKDADFCIFDPNYHATVKQEDFLFKNKLSPYQDKNITGKVHETILRGKTVYTHETGPSRAPAGQLLLEKRKSTYKFVF